MAISFIGPLPPPTHGQAVATAALQASLHAKGVLIHAVDIGGGTRRTGIGRSIVRTGQHVRAALEIMARSGWVYLSANSNSGLWLTGLLAAFARLKRRPIIVHHHSYAPGRLPIRAARFLTTAAGHKALHVVLCEAMARDFRAQNPGFVRIAALNNAGLVKRPSTPVSSNRRAGPLRLGHLSNLCAEKGISEVVASALHLVRSEEDVELVVAGPIADGHAAEAIELAKRKLGRRFRYLGPLYGEEKAHFLADIDIFIFPTKYRNEAQPLVIFEALAAGVPCAATACSCIKDDLGSAGVTATLEDLPEMVLRLCREYRSNSYRMQELARRRFYELLEEHEEQLTALHLLMLARS